MNDFNGLEPFFSYHLKYGDTVLTGDHNPLTNITGVDVDVVYPFSDNLGEAHLHFGMSYTYGEPNIYKEMHERMQNPLFANKVAFINCYRDACFNSNNKLLERIRMVNDPFGHYKSPGQNTPYGQVPVLRLYGTFDSDVNFDLCTESLVS